MRRLSLLIPFLLFFNELSANGGPFNPCSIVRVGDAELINMPNVELLREDLYIRIEGDYNVVTVKYRLRNQDYETDTILYGFPVDFADDIDGETGIVWRSDYVKDFGFSIDQKTLPVREQTDFSVFRDKLELIDHNFSGEHLLTVEENFRRKWYFTTFVLKQNATADLEVRYRVRNFSSDFASTKNLLPSYSRRSFRYDFTPASYWGKGLAGEFHLLIDDREVTRCGKTLKTGGPDLQRNAEGLLAFSKKQFDLGKAPDLFFAFELDEKFQSDYMREQMIPHTWISSLCATSAHRSGKYPAENLFDGDFSSVWLEGRKAGRGETWIEIRLLPGYELQSIAIANGYVQNQEMYDNHGRVKELQIEFEYPADEPGETEIFRDTIFYPDLPWRRIEDYNLAQICPIYEEEFGFYMAPVTRVRLTVLDVWPGKKHDAACISEVFLLGWKKRDESDE